MINNCDIAVEEKIQNQIEQLKSASPKKHSLWNPSD